MQRIKTFRCEIVVEERATRVANAIINLLFVCGAKRRRRTVGGVLSDRRKYGAGRGGGRVRCVWLLEETQAEQKGAYRKYGTIYIYLKQTRKLISRSTKEIQLNSIKRVSIIKINSFYTCTILIEIYYWLETKIILIF